MRDMQTNIYDFYKELADIHANSYPDMRPGQFLMCAFGDIQINQGVDPFFPEAKSLLRLIKIFVEKTQKGGEYR